MKLNYYHHDLTKDIDQSNSFSKCKLERQKYAVILTDIIRASNDGFVIAINNEWGSGKTTFVKMWQAYMNHAGLNTLYFNAWENDFENDVIVALVSEFEKKYEKKSKEFQKLVKNAAPLIKNVLSGVSKSLIKKYIGLELAEISLEHVVDFIATDINRRIEEYNKKKQSIQGFKDALKDLVSKDGDLIIIIDELDRCKPSYAVEVLESIKHLFNVPGIVFVLSLDKTQLCNSIRGYYGSDKLNAEEYLRRFIDIEYSLPQPSTRLFCRYLFDYFNFAAFTANPIRKEFGFKPEGQDLVEYAIDLFSIKPITLRTQERIFSHARVALTGFNYNYSFYPELFILLIYLRLEFYPIYRNLMRTEIKIQDLLIDLENVWPDHMLITEKITILICSLIVSYNESKKGVQREPYYNTDPIILNFKSRLLNSLNGDELIRWFERYGTKITRLEFFIERIELLADVIPDYKAELLTETI